MNIIIPQYVRVVLNRLRAGGFQAYVVGGCVRDRLLQKTPDDWDVCTEAEPDDMKACFIGLRSIDTGIQHGTVTVISGGKPVEVTTFRIDGTYSDGRHPDQVTFTSRLTDDLARRDFTINAMAYDEEQGIVDPFGGQEDLKRRVIRCVGDPTKRFREDALRIIRALRFSSKLDFSIEEETRFAIEKLAQTVRGVAMERVGTEFSKLTLGRAAARVLSEEREVLGRAGVDGLAEGAVLAEVGALPEELPVRLAVIFPQDVRKALRNLKFDNHTIALCEAIHEALHEEVSEENAVLRRQLYRHGLPAVRGMLQIRAAAPHAAPRSGAGAADCNGNAAAALRELQRIIEQGEVWNLKQLAVSGRDLIACGVPKGKTVGILLDWLLSKVIRGELKNDKAELLGAAESFLNA